MLISSMVLITHASAIRCAHCSEAGVCGSLIARGCDITSFDCARIHLGPFARRCKHVTQKSVLRMAVYAETEGKVHTISLAGGGDRGGTQALYSVALEGGAKYYVCEVPANDFVLGEDGSRFRGISAAASAMRVAPVFGGFTLEKVAFERRVNAPPALAVIIGPTGPLEIIGRDDNMQTKPLCYASLVPFVTSTSISEPDRLLVDAARSIFETGTLDVSMDGRRTQVYVPAADNQILQGSYKTWRFPTLEVRRVVEFAAACAKQMAVTLGWRVRPGDFDRWVEEKGFV